MRNTESNPSAECLQLPQVMKGVELSRNGATHVTISASEAVEPRPNLGNLFFSTVACQYAMNAQTLTFALKYVRWAQRELLLHLVLPCYNCMPQACMNCGPSQHSDLELQTLAFTNYSPDSPVLQGLTGKLRRPYTASVRVRSAEACTFYSSFIIVYRGEHGMVSSTYVSADHLCTFFFVIYS